MPDNPRRCGEVGAALPRLGIVGARSLARGTAGEFRVAVVPGGGGALPKRMLTVGEPEWPSAHGMAVSMARGGGSVRHLLQLHEQGVEFGIDARKGVMACLRQAAASVRAAAKARIKRRIAIESRQYLPRNWKP